MLNYVEDADLSLELPVLLLRRESAAAQNQSDAADFIIRRRKPPLRFNGTPALRRHQVGRPAGRHAATMPPGPHWPMRGQT